jgi:type III restriction enzyme
MATLLDVTLVRTPEICGGSLRIDGTRMTVNQIVALHLQGLSAEEIVDQYPHRTLREIYGVLAWYYDHKTEFDRELAEEEAEYDRLKAENQRTK